MGKEPLVTFGEVFVGVIFLLTPEDRLLVEESLDEIPCPRSTLLGMSASRDFVLDLANFISFTVISEITCLDDAPEDLLERGRVVIEKLFAVSQNFGMALTQDEAMQSGRRFLQILLARAETSEEASELAELIAATASPPN